jgi:hypothetical protein
MTPDRARAYKYIDLQLFVVGKSNQIHVWKIMYNVGRRTARRDRICPQIVFLKIMYNIGRRTT